MRAARVVEIYDVESRDFLVTFLVIQLAIETIAKYAQVQLIDFHAPLYPYPFMLPDAVHPDKEGAAVLAKTVYEGRTGI